MKILSNWYEILDSNQLPTPCLLWSEQIIRQNIQQALQYVQGYSDRLRPHLKTTKSKNIISFFQEYGIHKFKTSTISETKMAAESGAKDILLAYSLFNKNLQIYIQLISNYPNTQFSTLLDNVESAKIMNNIAELNTLNLSIYLDLNTGMNRTGFNYSKDLKKFIQIIQSFKNLTIIGLHIYDGHLLNEDWQIRTKNCNQIIEKIKAVEKELEIYNLEWVCGGSGSFYFYAQKNKIVCSPGTFVLWDYNYLKKFPELNFKIAAVLCANVVSKPAANLICINIGHKAVGAENSINHRIAILNYPNLILQSQSEEHSVFLNAEELEIPIGSVIYAEPFHICPTVNLYNSIYLIEDQKIKERWLINNNRILN